MVTGSYTLILHFKYFRKACHMCMSTFIETRLLLESNLALRWNMRVPVILSRLQRVKSLWGNVESIVLFVWLSIGWDKCPTVKACYISVNQFLHEPFTFHFRWELVQITKLDYQARRYSSACWRFTLLCLYSFLHACHLYVSNSQSLMGMKFILRKRRPEPNNTSKITN